MLIQFANNNKFLFSRIFQPVTNRLFSLELAILGCNVSTDSMKSVIDVFREIGPKLNLATNLPVENFEPLKVKKYLKENHLKFCVLVVDAATVKDAYDNLDERKLEYEDLLTTAAHEVGKFDFYLQMKEKGFSPPYSTRWIRRRLCLYFHMVHT